MLTCDHCEPSLEYSVRSAARRVRLVMEMRWSGLGLLNDDLFPLENSYALE